MQESRIQYARAPVGAPLQSQTNSPDHILVVDDDLLFRRLHTGLLLRSGYEVDAVADSAAAWQALITDGYDLVITDNNLPDASGVELLKKLRSAHMALPVIMATGTSPREEFTGQPWLQPAATLLKPYTAEEMLRAVKKVLREAGSTADGSQLSIHRDMQDKEISQPGTPARATRQYPANSSRRILVVDEDRDLRQLYADALAGHGYNVDAASDGAAGWAALQANRYHLLITEHEIPSLNGVELIKKLRAARMALPVIMAAGRLPTHELARNPSLQLAATLAKPFAVDALVDTVKNALRASDIAPEHIEPLPVWGRQPSADALRLI